MRIHSRIFAAAVVAVSAVALLGTGGASGTPDEAPAGAVPAVELTAAERQALQAQVDQHLGDYGGGQQIGINQIAYESGAMILTLPLPGEKKARAVDEPVTAFGVANCAYLYACLWRDTNFNGDRLARTACGTINLGSPFNSSTGSIHNNQTSGTQTIVFNANTQILNASMAPSRINDTGVGSRSQIRRWKVC